MNWIIYLAIAFFMFSACKKKEKHASNVTITYVEPSIGDTIASYNQVHAEGTIEGDGLMESYTVSAIDNSTGLEIFKNTYETRANAYNFHEHWTNNLSDTTILTIQVTVIKDTDGNTVKKERTVVCLP